jgi:hypothetical protein
MGTSNSDTHLEMHEVASGGPDGEALPGPRTRLRRPGPAMVAATLWAVAAACAFAFPFDTVFRYQVTLRPDGTVGTQSISAYDIDGWGRTHIGSARASGLLGGQPPWFGMAAYVGAALLVAAVLVGTRSAPRARGSALVAGGVLAAVVVAEVVRITALSSDVRGQALEPTVAVHDRVGPGIVLAACAVLCATAGLIVSLRARRY